MNKDISISNVSLGKLFLKATAFIIGFILLQSAVVFAYVQSKGGPEAFEALAIQNPTTPWIMIFLVFASYLIFFLWVPKYIFHFKSSLPSQSLEVVRKGLESLKKEGQALVLDEKKPNKFVITQNYLDAKWWEVFQRRGMRGVFEIQVKLMPEKKEVHIVEINKRVNWGAGPQSLKLHASYFRGVSMQFERAYAFGIKEDFTLGVLYDYYFDSVGVRNTVANYFLNSGWDVRFTLFV